MNRFLNSKHDISDAAITDASLEPSGEVAESIALFRAAMHSVAMHSVAKHSMEARETAQPVASVVANDWLQPARHRQRHHQRTTILAWSSAMACAAALSFAIVPRALQTHTAAHNDPVHVAAQPQSEASYTALLEQVDNEIAEPVPSSLAPLTELDSWNSTGSTTPTENKNVTQ
jgi:hypothetical protein